MSEQTELWSDMPTIWMANGKCPVTIFVSESGNLAELSTG